MLGKNARALYLDKLGLLPTDCVEMGSSSLLFFGGLFVLTLFISGKILHLIKLKSTDVDRTIKSAYHFMGGLFPSCEGVIDLEVERAKVVVFSFKRLTRSLSVGETTRFLIACCVLGLERWSNR